MRNADLRTTVAPREVFACSRTVEKVLDAVFRRVEEEGAHGAVLVLVTEKLQRAAAFRGLSQR